MLTVINLDISRKELEGYGRRAQVSTYLLVYSVDSLRADNRMFRMFQILRKQHFHYYPLQLNLLNLKLFSQTTEESNQSIC